MLIAVVALASLVAAAVTLWRRAPAFDLVRAGDQNVLLVTIDTLRADALGSYGGRAATPNLDRLAQEGLRFDFAHAHAVVTLPSHASIMTGRYPFEHGIRDNSGYRLPSDARTLAGLLKAQGFATGAFVGAFPLDSRFGLDSGFDVYDDRFGEAEGPADFTIAERPAAAVVDAALAWIQGQRGRWFAWVHVFDPHAGYEPPPPFDQQYAGDPYHGEVAYTDRALGPLLDAARAASRPTLAIVTSDHGEALGDHGEVTHGLFAYEATLRVPLIVAQLPAPRPGRLVPDLAARHVDLLPTIFDALGLPQPVGLPGRSLLAGVQAEDAGVRDSYFEAMSASLNRAWAPLAGVLAGREKFIDLPIPELYDVAADPGEHTNLADARTDRRRAMEARLRLFAATPAAERGAESAEVAEHLRALGYVAGSAPRKERYTEADDPKRLVDLDRAIHEGVDLYQRGRAREAVDVYRRVLDRRPDMEIAYRHLAFLHWSLGEIGEAIGTLKRAVAAGAASAAIRTQLGTYLAESGSPADAIALLEDAASGDGSDPDALNALGIAYARAGRHERALETFRRLLARDADNAMALENIGAVHLQRGDLAEARRAFERAVALAPRSARAHSGLGAVRIKTGDRAGAIQSWRQAVELDPQDFDALYNLATELVNAGQLEAARPYLERFVRAAPPAFYADDIRRLSKLLGSMSKP